MGTKVSRRLGLIAAALFLALSWLGGSSADQVIPDDLIVQGSVCVGFDCVNNEDFGFDTVRLKENNLRIRFLDTSVGSFPSNDWEITANDSASGGANRFSIMDITGARTPFTIEAGSATNSLYLDSTGRIGLRTATPVLDLHLLTGNTPAIRLDQAGGGFTPQIWDVAGNEANFFVRDVTGGSRLPFRILPGAPTNSLGIAASGNVGLGVLTATKQLHVLGASADPGSANNTMIRVENTSGTTAGRRMLELVNKGAPQLQFRNTANGVSWLMNPTGTSFRMNRAGSGVNAFTLQATGNLTIAGTLTENSDRESKTEFAPVEGGALLTRLAALPITTWRYKAEAPGVRHVGPTAQDFRAAFGLGEDDQHIAPRDLAAVGLAATQALHAMAVALEEKTAELERKAALLDQLMQRLAALEARVGPPAAPRE